MTIGLVGRKVGMMRIFTDEGDAQPVTVLDVSDNRITQIKTADKDGYSAVQVAFGKRRASRVRKPLAGHLAKAAVEAGHVLKEFRAEPKALEGLKVGGKIGVEIFQVGQKVDVQGTTIGKGFAGVIKRHHFGGNRATHGNSITTRAQGSTGQRQDPGRVFKGKRMAGHMGQTRVTTQNIVVVSTEADTGMIVLKGAVPGSPGTLVRITDAVKVSKKPQPKDVPFPAGVKGGGKKAEAPKAEGG